MTLQSTPAYRSVLTASGSPDLMLTLLRRHLVTHPALPFIAAPSFSLPPHVRPGDWNFSAVVFAPSAHHTGYTALLDVTLVSRTRTHDVISATHYPSYTLRTYVLTYPDSLATDLVTPFYDAGAPGADSLFPG